MSETAARVFLPAFVTPIARSTGSTVGILDLIAGAAAVGCASRAIKESDYGAFNCPFSTDSNGQPNVECQGVLPFGIEIGTSEDSVPSRRAAANHDALDWNRAGVDSLSVVISSSNTALNDAIEAAGGLDIADLQVLFADGPKNFEDAPSLNGTSLGPVSFYIPDVNSGTFDFFQEVVCVVEFKSRWRHVPGLWIDGF